MKKLTVSIIVRPTQKWLINEFNQAAKARDLNINFLHLTSYSKKEEYTSQLGDITFWKQHSIKGWPQKVSVFYHFSKYTTLLNSYWGENSLISSKLYQQVLLENRPDVEGIQTFSFNSKKELLDSISKKELQFPIVNKTLQSSQGTGVSLLKNITQIRKLSTKTIQSTIFQNYIENSGDYRVFVLGQKVIAIMERKAKKGDFRNNFSQGGEIFPVKNKQLKKNLSDIAKKTTKLFKLDICGVDIIYDAIAKQYKVIEINTKPSWDGIQKITKKSIAGSILDYGIQLHKKSRKQYS